METWKPIQTLNGIYEVSNFARIRRIARGKKFDANQIIEAKQMLTNGCTLKQVANFLQTSITTIMAIKHGKTWAGDAKFRIIKTHIARDNYIRFTACINGKMRKIAVHRAMWEAFNGQIPNGLEVNHKNLDRADNRLDNLELLTHQENIRHAFNIYRKIPAARQPKGRAGSYRGKYFKHA